MADKGRVAEKKSVDECPDWVKKAKKCDAFIRITKSAEEYAYILESKYEITETIHKNNDVIIKFKRGNLIGEFTLTGLEDVKKVSFEKNKIKIEFSKKSKITLAVASGATGFSIATLIFTILLIVLLL